jgi:hypothetical protein
VNSLEYAGTVVLVTRAGGEEQMETKARVIGPNAILRNLDFSCKK